MYYNNNYYYGGYNNLPRMNFSRVYPRVVVYGSNFNRWDGEAGDLLSEIPLSKRDTNYMLARMGHYYGDNPKEISGSDSLGVDIAEQAGHTNSAIQRYKDAVREVRKELPELSPEGKKVLTKRFADLARVEQNAYNKMLAQKAKNITMG